MQTTQPAPATAGSTQTSLFGINESSTTYRALRDVTHASDCELLACILGEDVPAIAGQILRERGSLAGIFGRDARELTRYPKIGPKKAAMLAAIGELARRVQSQEARAHVQVCSPEDVAAVYSPIMRDLKREQFRVVFLNTANRITGDVVVSEGGLAAAIVEPRAVFQTAVLENAAALICIHNHPSGNSEPSREDIRITRQLVEAGKLLGIPVHDHLIIAGDRYTSLAEHKLMDF